jgi:hypothetical protein
MVGEFVKGPAIRSEAAKRAKMHVILDWSVAT